MPTQFLTQWLDLLLTSIYTSACFFLSFYPHWLILNFNYAYILKKCPGGWFLCLIKILNYSAFLDFPVPNSSPPLMLCYHHTPIPAFRVIHIWPLSFHFLFYLPNCFYIYRMPCFSGNYIKSLFSKKEFITAKLSFQIIVAAYRTTRTLLHWIICQNVWKYNHFDLVTLNSLWTIISLLI